MTDYELDVMNQVCPIPAALTRKKVVSMLPGDTLTIQGDCDFAVDNVIRMIEKNGAEVIDKNIAGEIFTIKARKK